MIIVTSEFGWTFEAVKIVERYTMESGQQMICFLTSGGVHTAVPADGVVLEHRS